MNGNAPVTPGADFKPANTVPGSTAARAGARSLLRATSRPQTSAKASAADGTTKHNQSKEHAEKKRQAVAQLRRMLVQGNKRVEALATVIQHVFSEVLQLKRSLRATAKWTDVAVSMLVVTLAQGYCPF